MAFDDDARARAALTKVARSRSRVLEATKTLIQERGAFRVEMKDIVEESGVSGPTIYRLFGGKPEVLEEAFAALVPDTVPEELYKAHVGG